MNISLQSLRDVLTVSLCRNFAPDNRMPATVWSEQMRRLEGGRRYSFDYAHYQREMMETPYRLEVQMTVFEMASRLGKTEVCMNILGHGVSEVPRRALIMYPTISQAEKFSKETLQKELIDPTPCLSELLGDDRGRRKSGGTLLHKIFPGGLINIFGGNAAGEMRRAKGNLQIADEIDALEEQQGDEGDQLEIFWMRGSEYPDAIKIAASYPSRRGRSRVEALMLQSDFRRWFTVCPKCSLSYVMHRNQVTWPDGQPERAEFICPNPNCAVALDDAARRAMNRTENGALWKPTRPFHGIAGFHGGCMMSPHPAQKGLVSHLHFLAVQEIKAGKAQDPERARRVLVNTLDAETYESAAERTKPKAEELHARREDYIPAADATPDTPRTLPAGVGYITAGGDAQDDRLIAQIVGWGVGEEAWVLGYIIEFGDTQKPDVYRRMREQLEKMSFVHPAGPTLRIAKYCPDTRHNKEQGRAMCASMKVVRAYPIVGINGYGEEIVTRSKRLKKAVWIVASVPAKQLLYSRFGTKEPGPGYVHFPMWLDMAYFNEVTSEHEEITVRDGQEIVKFEKPSHVANEALDTFAYALAALRHGPPHVNLERLMAKMVAEAEPPVPETPVLVPDPRARVEGTLAKLRPARPARSGSFATSWQRK